MARYAVFFALLFDTQPARGAEFDPKPVYDVVAKALKEDDE